MARILDIEGIGPAHAKKLKEIGVTNTDHLLDKGSTPKGRKDLADKTGIGEHLVLKWVNHADLFRIKGVAGEYAELLEAAGVDTVVELAKRVPENLVEKMEAVNKEKKLVRRTPALSLVKGWVDQAKKMPRSIQY